MQDDGIGRLVAAGRVRRAIVSWARSPAGPIPIEALIRGGKAELELVPQGTLAERIHAAGSGVPAFFTATSVGTPLAHGKEHREIDGRTYVLEKAIFDDVALIEAWQADRWGNLTYRRAGRNLNPVMSAAAKLTIVQAQHLVELGAIDPDHIASSLYASSIRFDGSLPVASIHNPIVVSSDIGRPWIFPRNWSSHSVP